MTRNGVWPGSWTCPIASLFIQFNAQNGGQLSRRKREEFFPEIDDSELAPLEAAVRASGIVGLGRERLNS